MELQNAANSHESLNFSIAPLTVSSIRFHFPVTMFCDRLEMELWNNRFNEMLNVFATAVRKVYFLTLINVTPTKVYSSSTGCSKFILLTTYNVLTTHPHHRQLIAVRNILVPSKQERNQVFPYMAQFHFVLGYDVYTSSRAVRPITGFVCFSVMNGFPHHGVPSLLIFLYHFLVFNFPFCSHM